MTTHRPTISQAEARRVRNAGLAVLTTFVVIAGVIGLSMHSVDAFIYSLFIAGAVSFVVVMPIALVVSMRIDRMRSERDWQPPHSG
jgi:predicted Kef-type K+ transport protein